MLFLKYCQAAVIRSFLGIVCHVFEYDNFSSFVVRNLLILPEFHEEASLVGCIRISGSCCLFMVVVSFIFLIIHFMKKFIIYSLSVLALSACNKNNASPEPDPVSYETISFEDCVIPENTTNNIPASGETVTYEEAGAQFTCVNQYYELGGIWVANNSEKSDWDQEYSRIPSDRCVICNVDPAFTGADDTAQYSVWAFTPSNDEVVPQMTFAGGVARKVVSAKVNNVAKYWHIIKAGYYSKPGFSDGDYYEVVFTGYDASGAKTGSVPVVLADFRDGKSFIMEEWTEVDLSALGEVNSIALTATPSETLSAAFYGDYYAVCVDEIKVEAQDPAAE